MRAVDSIDARTHSIPNFLTTIIRVKSLALTIIVVSTTPVQTVASTEAPISYVSTIADMCSVMRTRWKGPDAHGRNEAALSAIHKPLTCALVGSLFENGVTGAVGTSCKESSISFGDGPRPVKQSALLLQTMPVTKLNNGGTMAHLEAHGLGTGLGKT